MADDIHETSDLTDAAAWPRWVTLALGVWLFISAFVWPHAASAMTNTWILGLLIVLGAAWSMYEPRVRYLDTLFAIWLLFSTLVIQHHESATLWNNLIVAVIVFVLSLIPSRATTPRTGSRPLHV